MVDLEQRGFNQAGLGYKCPLRRVSGTEWKIEAGCGIGQVYFGHTLVAIPCCILVILTLVKVIRGPDWGLYQEVEEMQRHT